MQHPFLKALDLALPWFLPHDTGTTGDIGKRLPGLLSYDTCTSGVYRKKEKKKFPNLKVWKSKLHIFWWNKDLNDQIFCPDPGIHKKRGLDTIFLSLEKKTRYQRLKY